jgi:hypothetical protein
MRTRSALLFGLATSCAGSREEPFSDSAQRDQSQWLIYGNDDRVEVFESPSRVVRDFARSSLAALVFSHRLRYGESAQLAYDLSSLAEAKHLCQAERFSDQPALAACSGVLIDDDLLLTAGHCLGKDAEEARSYCRDLTAVFDFHYTAHGELELASDDARTCRTVSVHRFVDGDGNSADFAVLQLDRAAGPERAPASIAARAVEALESTICIGNGGGLPTKVDAGGRILEAQTHPEFFRATTDSFVGGSGSAVLDARLELLGIQSRGNPDFGFNGTCNQVLVQSDGSELHQKASRAVEALCASGWPSMRLCQRAPACGDSVCSASETSATCPEDCPEETCGDGVCRVVETRTCDADCGRLNRVPSGWWCPTSSYADGAVCDCECGASDPDCTGEPDLEVRGCSAGRTCSDLGTCKLVGRPSEPSPTESDSRVGTGSGCALANGGPRGWWYAGCLLSAILMRKLRRVRTSAAAS